MLAAFIIIAVMGIGLPAVAWAASRRAESHPERLQAAPGDYDQWLLRKYGLGPHDRVLVQLTVLGRHAFPVLDAREAVQPAPLRPELREAARGLAERVAAGRLRTARLSRRDAWSLLALGTVIAGIAMAALLTTWGKHLITTGSDFAGCAPILLIGAYAGLVRPHLRRRSAQRYLAASACGSHDGGLSESASGRPQK